MKYSIEERVGSAEGLKGGLQREGSRVGGGGECRWKGPPQEQRARNRTKVDIKQRGLISS